MNTAFVRDSGSHQFAATASFSSTPTVGPAAKIPPPVPMWRKPIFAAGTRDKADFGGRLLGVVLEDAIRTYLANRTCSNPIQCKKFQEVRSWFESGRTEAQLRLLDFQTICEFLGIDPCWVLTALKSLDAREFPPRRHRPLRSTRPRSVATSKGS
jgi:hypothetical protein